MTKQSFRVESGRLEYVSRLAIAGLFSGMVLTAILEVIGVNPGLALLVSTPATVLFGVSVMFWFLINVRNIATAIVTLFAMQVGTCIVLIAIGHEHSFLVWILIFVGVVLGVASFIIALLPLKGRQG